MLDPVRLKAFDIPSREAEWTARDTALYALSVGVGRDPMDERRLRFVTQTDRLAALPTMATVLAAPGFWLADPASGVDPRSALHGEQWIELSAPLPAAGRFASSTKIVGLVDKGEGRDAILHLLTTLSERGRTLAALRRSLVLRGQGGFGTGHEIPVEVPSAAIREGAPDATVRVETRPEQALYYALNGDTNPLHVDPAAAKAAGFERPILHGLCTYGIAAHAIVETLCEGRPERLSGLGVRFSGIVYPGETVEVAVWKNGAFTARVVERDTPVLTNGTATLA